MYKLLHKIPFLMQLLLSRQNYLIFKHCSTICEINLMIFFFLPIFEIGSLLHQKSQFIVFELVQFAGLSIDGAACHRKQSFLMQLSLNRQNHLIFKHCTMWDKSYYHFSFINFGNWIIFVSKKSSNHNISFSCLLSSPFAVRWRCVSSKTI